MFELLLFNEKRNVLLKLFLILIQKTVGIMPKSHHIVTIFGVMTMLLFNFLPEKLSAQKVVASLQLDKKHPKPLWFEYCKQDEGLATISYATKNSSRYLAVNKYNHSFEPVWKQNLYEQNGNRMLENMTVLGDKILIFTQDYLPKEKLYQIKYFDYSLGGTVRASEKLLYSTEQGEKDKRLYTYNRSLNLKKMLAFHTYQRKDEKQKIQFHVFDATSDIIKTGLIQLDYLDKDLQIKNVKIGNEGNIFILAKFYLTNRVKNPDDYKYKLFIYNVENKELREVQLSFDNKFITDLTFKPDRDENVILAGFYSNKNASGVIGVLYARVEKGTSVVAVQNFQPFDSKLLQNYLTSKQIEKGRELIDFYLDDIILRSDGGLLILAEQYYTTSASYRDAYGMWYTRNVHHYDDVIVTSISSEGKIEWNALIEKNQSGEYTDELSYLSLVGSENIYIFYKSRLKGLGNNVYVNTVDYEGKTGNPHTFFDSFSTSDIFYREFSEQVSNNEAILAYYQSRERIFSLLKVEF